MGKLRLPKTKEGREYIIPIEQVILTCLTKEGITLTLIGGTTFGVHKKNFTDEDYIKIEDFFTKGAVTL